MSLRLIYGARFARNVGCSFHVSTATCYDEVEHVFTKIVRGTPLDLKAREAMSCALRDSNIKIKEIVARRGVVHRAMSLPRVINFAFPLQPHQNFDITQYGELGFSYIAHSNQR